MTTEERRQAYARAAKRSARNRRYYLRHREQVIARVLRNRGAKIGA